MQISSSELKQQAKELGFQACAVADSGEIAHGAYFEEWLRDGKFGEMKWMERDTEVRMDTSRLMPESRTAILLGMNYFQHRPACRGVVARYALGMDYHDLIMQKTRDLIAWILREFGGTHRPFVDTSAVMEKGHATRAGLGWQGKNTMLIDENFGNWLFLSGILTSLDFEADQPAKDRCGTCSRCIDVCPTGAITAPYQLDARRCISYLTIEHKGAIPLEFRKAIGDRLYGCDDCLDICPWNRRAVQTNESVFQARQLPDLRDMLAWRDTEFRKFFRGTPIFRLKWNRWLRNICVVLGNIGTHDDLHALREAADCGEPLVAEHAQWAVAQIEKRQGT